MANLPRRCSIRGHDRVRRIHRCRDPDVAQVCVAVERGPEFAAAQEDRAAGAATAVAARFGERRPRAGEGRPRRVLRTLPAGAQPRHRLVHDRPGVRPTRQPERRSAARPAGGACGQEDAPRRSPGLRAGERQSVDRGLRGVLAASRHPCRQAARPGGLRLLDDHPDLARGLGGPLDGRVSGLFHLRNGDGLRYSFDHPARYRRRLALGETAGGDAVGVRPRPLDQRSPAAARPCRQHRRRRRRRRVLVLVLPLRERLGALGDNGLGWPRRRSRWWTSARACGLRCASLPAWSASCKQRRTALCLPSSAGPSSTTTTADPHAPAWAPASADAQDPPRPGR